MKNRRSSRSPRPARKSAGQHRARQLDEAEERLIEETLKADFLQACQRYVDDIRDTYYSDRRT